MDKKETQTKNNKNSKIFNFFNNPVTIIVTLILFAILLMLYNRYLVNSMNLYTFTGFNDDISIINGTIYTGYDINYFGDSKALYTGRDIQLSTYEVGYFIKNKDKYTIVAVTESIQELENSASLKEIVETIDFSFTEVSKDALYLSKDNIKNIDKLTFKISGTDELGNEVSIEIPLTVTKMSK